MSCDVDGVTESLENELCSFSLTSPGEPPMILRTILRINNMYYVHNLKKITNDITLQHNFTSTRYVLIDSCFLLDV